MLNHILIATLATSLFCSSAMAWETLVDEDPLDDTKTAILQGSTPIGDIGIGVKCWESKPDEAILVVTTSEKFDAAANYKDSLEVIFRSDKNETRNVFLSPTNLSGILAFTFRDSGSGVVLGVLSDFALTKNMVALGLGSSVHKFPAKGIGKSVQKLVQTCKITLPTP
jgi:hypothetical protein